MTLFKVNLIVTPESQRQNRFISSRLVSQATIFYPASQLTPTMKSKLIEMAKGGGTDPNSPLESTYINWEGKHYRIDLHADYLLQVHRDILDVMLAFAETIQLDDVSYSNCNHFSWKDVYQTIDKVTEIQQNNLDSSISSDATILSMSLNELATKIGLSSTKKNHEKIQRCIIQMATTHLVINELSEDRSVRSKRPLKLIQDYRFCYNKSHTNSERNTERALINHVFLIPDKRLLQSIRDHGYCYRLDQHKITQYTKASVRSFLKYIISNQLDTLNNKTLDWALDCYLHSIASKVSHDFRNRLKIDLLENAKQIEQHFYLRFQYTDQSIQIFYTGDG